MTVPAERAQDVTPAVALGAGLGRVRFGRRERTILLNAYGSEQPVLAANAAVYEEEWKELVGPNNTFASLSWEDQLKQIASRRVSRLRARAKLRRIGLINRCWRQDLPGERLELTDLGRLVVDTFRHELETGGRIRWAKLATAAGE